MAKNRKRKKGKLKRKYGQQDKIVFRRVVRREVVQERPKTIKERLIETRERQQAGREQQERVKRVYEKVLPPGMSYTDYVEYIEKKKAEAREKGAHFRY